MIKNLIFDLGGVLLDIDLPYCMKQVQSLGINLDDFSAKTTATTPPSSSKPAVMGEGIIANGIINLYQVGAITTEVFFSTIQQHCRPGTTLQQVLDAWNSCCIGIPQYRLDKVMELKQKGYHTYMLSNTNDAHWIDIVNRCFGGQQQVNRYFDRVFLSQEMHLAKPNDDIYLEVLQKIQAQPDECLFIDDSTPNIEAAQALGFHTIHASVSLTREGKVINPPESDWTTSIDDML